MLHVFVFVCFFTKSVNGTLSWSLTLTCASISVAKINMYVLLRAVIFSLFNSKSMHVVIITFITIVLTVCFLLLLSTLSRSLFWTLLLEKSPWYQYAIGFVRNFFYWNFENVTWIFLSKLFLTKRFGYSIGNLSNLRKIKFVYM